MRISASSLKLFRQCPRCWVRRYVEGVREAETAANTLGTQTHAELEAWLREGVLPPSELARRMLALYGKRAWAPTRHTVSAEAEFEFTLHGITWRGYIDWRGVLAPGHHIVGDWKTGNLDYALQAGDGVLIDSDGHVDVQSLLYTAREVIEGAKRVTLNWVYGSSKDERTRLVECEADLGRLEEEFVGMERDARAMLELLERRPPTASVPFNGAVVRSYGKPHVCLPPSRGMFADLDPLDTQGAITVASFLDSIRSSFPTPAELEAPPPPPPEADEPPPPPPAEEDDAPPPPPEEAPHPAEVLAEAYAASTEAPGAFPETVESGFINPPEAEGKPVYRTPEEAAAGEGVEPVPEKKPKAPPKKRASKSKAKAEEIVETVGEPIVDSNGFTLTAGQRFDTKTGEDLRAKYAEQERAAEAPAVEIAPGVFATAGSIEEKVFTTPAFAATTSADDVLRQIYLTLKDHFEQR